MLPWLLHGNPLPCSCLENPTDRGAWRAAAHGVTESQTRLSDRTITQGSEIHSFLSRDSSLLPLEPPSPPSTPLGHHRAPSWAPCLHSGFPLAVYFTHGGVCVYVSATLSISSHPLLHTRCPLFKEQTVFLNSWFFLSPPMMCKCSHFSTPGNTCDFPS